MRNAVHLPETVSPHTIELTEEVFHAIIHRAFREITRLNTIHFMGHNIKVAHSCVRGYLLSMNRYFYDYYDFEDDEMERLYLPFADAFYSISFSMIFFNVKLTTNGKLTF